MADSGSSPVIAGLAVGIAFVVLVSAMIKPNFMLSDEELVAKYSEFAEVKYFLAKYPDAKAEVSRSPNENYHEISYNVERQVEPASELYTGINIFGIQVYPRPNHLSFGLSCGVHQGLTIGWGFEDIDAIDEAEKSCFHIADNEGVFEPDPDGDLMGGVFLSEENDADGNNGDDPPVSVDLPRYPTE